MRRRIPRCNNDSHCLLSLAASGSCRRAAGAPVAYGAGPAAEPPRRAQTASPSQPRGLRCAVFRSARVPLGVSRSLQRVTSSGRFPVAAPMTPVYVLLLRLGARSPSSLRLWQHRLCDCGWRRAGPWRSALRLACPEASRLLRHAQDERLDRLAQGERINSGHAEPALSMAEGLVEARQHPLFELLIVCG
jgi:hypothetical protein